jgi:hypothetical protein
MALLEARINGVWTALPTPEKEDYYTVYEHLEDSFLNAQGFLKREIIRRNRAKVFCGWKFLTGDQVALLQSLYEFDDFMLRFTDNYNNRVEKKVYAGPLTSRAKYMNSTTFEITQRTQNQMNFIEV